MSTPVLTELILKYIMPKANIDNIRKFLVPLNLLMPDYGIVGHLRVAHFLAQVAHESGQLQFTEELGSGESYEGRKDLGNLQPGDGPRFKGRGLIQITGRTNYEAYSAYRGEDFLAKPKTEEIATTPHLCVDVAGWFWMSRKLNNWADEDNLLRVTQCVNGGFNGFARRSYYLVRAKAALSAAATVDAFPLFGGTISNLNGNSQYERGELEIDTYLRERI